MIDLRFNFVSASQVAGTEILELFPRTSSVLYIKVSQSCLDTLNALHFHVYLDKVATFNVERRTDH